MKRLDYALYPKEGREVKLSRYAFQELKKNREASFIGDDPYRYLGFDIHVSDQQIEAIIFTPRKLYD